MLPNWLYQYGYPLAGPASEHSMKPILLINAESKWGIGTLPGWYYINQQLHYNYVTPATASITASSGSGSTTYSQSLRPAWAPVLLYGSSEETVTFTSAAATGSWTPNTGTLITALSSSNGDTAYAAWGSGSVATLNTTGNYLPGPGTFTVQGNVRTTAGTGILNFSLFAGSVLVGSGTAAVTGTSYHNFSLDIAGTKYFNDKVITLTVGGSGAIRLTYLNLTYPFINQRKYTQHQWHYWPAVQSTWTLSATSNVYYTQHAFDELCCEVMGLDFIPYGQAPNIDELSTKNYYYDSYNRKIYVRSISNPSGTVFPGYVKADPQLRIREKLWLKNGLAYTLYSEVAAVTYSRGSQTNSVTGNLTSPLTPTLTGLNDYDWLIVEYNVPYSFCLPKHNKVNYYTSPTSGETITVNYETSPPFNIKSLSVLGSGSIQELNLNPLFNNCFAEGYLYQDSSSTSLTGLSTPNQILIEFDKDSYVSDWKEKVGLTITVLDRNKSRCPYYPVNLNITNGNVFYSSPGTSMTGADGVIRLVLTATGNVTVAATGSTSTNTASCLDLSRADILTSDSYLAGQINLAITDTLENHGFFESYCNAARLDGIPFAGSNISIIGSNGTQFVYDNANSRNLLNIKTQFSMLNLWGLSNRVGILPAKVDRIYARQGKGQSILARSNN